MSGATLHFFYDCINTRRTRIALMLLLDAAIIAVSYFVAFWLRIDVIEQSPHFVYDNRYFLDTLPWLVAVRLAYGWLCKTYHWSFRHASLSENVDLILAVLFGSITFVLLGHILQVFRAPPPRSIYVLEAAMTYAGMALLRFAPRYLLSLWTQRLRVAAGGDAKRALIYGGGGASEMVARELLRSYGHGYALVGFIDDNPAAWNSSIHGVKVLGGMDALPEVLSKNAIDQILAPESGFSGQQMRRLVDICGPLGVKLKKIPDYGRVLDASSGIAQHLEDFSPEALLDRQPVRFDAVDMDRMLRGTTVMITGAAGTIGSELCRQILACSIKRLVIYDINENGLFFLEAELRAAYPGADVALAIGSIRDGRRLNEIMRTHRPDMVFHAAAHKHVPVLESAPGEAIKNNVLGTHTVAEACMANGVGRMVLISTDKAVMSASVLGASKRLAEVLVRNLKGKSATQFLSVRFGNVLDSNGSLVDVVRRQIAKGGPVTVTHRDMVRYFMTIREAAGLVLVAAVLGEGDISVLDMGDPISVDALVRQILFLHGLTPGKDIDIVYAGVRPGEKFSEALHTDREVMRESSFPKISIIDDGELLDMEAMLADARAAAASGDAETAREFFLAWVKDYRPAGMQRAEAAS